MDSNPWAVPVCVDCRHCVAGRVEHLCAHKDAVGLRFDPVTGRVRRYVPTCFEQRVGGWGAGTRRVEFADGWADIQIPLCGPFAERFEVRAKE